MIRAFVGLAAGAKVRAKARAFASALVQGSVIFGTFKGTASVEGASGIVADEGSAAGAVGFVGVESASVDTETVVVTFATSVGAHAAFESVEAKAAFGVTAVLACRAAGVGTLAEMGLVGGGGSAAGAGGSVSVVGAFVGAKTLVIVFGASFGPNAASEVTVAFSCCAAGVGSLAEPGTLGDGG